MVEYEGYWPIAPNTEETTMSMQRKLLKDFADWLIAEDAVIQVETGHASMEELIDEFMAIRRANAQAVDSTPLDTGKWG